MDKANKIMDQQTVTPWTHPATRAPKSVLVAALGPTKHDLLEHQTGHEPDASMQLVDEVWGVNAGGNWFSGRVAFDVLFVLDYLEGEAARLPRYGEHLREWHDRHGRPVITSRAGRHDWALEYPLDWVCERVMQHNPAPPYFHNSIPLVLAYAWAIGVERLYLWGADYSHEALKRREDDRPNAEYWVGWCRAMGMEVILPSTTTLCNANQAFWVYGYPPGADRHPQWSGGRFVWPGIGGAHAEETLD